MFRTYFTPRLAADAQIDDTPLLLALRKGVSLKDSRDAIVNAAQAVVKDKLAKDADIDDIANLLDAIEDVVDEPIASIPDEVTESDLENGELEVRDVDNDGEEEIVRDGENDTLIAKIREFIKDRVDESTLAEFDTLVAGEHEPEEVIEELKDDEEDDMTKDSKRMARDNGFKPVAKTTKPIPAMDAAAIERLVEARVTQERANMRAVQAALTDVRPVVGEIVIACDSADDVYGHALGMLGRDVTNVPPAAYKPMFDIARDAKKSAAAASRRTIAVDSAADGVPSVAELFPSVARIKRG
jgi:hypothetical protein